MQVEFDTGHRTFRSIPNNSVFICEVNGKVYVKKDYDSAIDLETQTAEGFCAIDGVIPCTITKIVVRK